MAEEENLVKNNERNVTDPKLDFSNTRSRLFEIHVRGQLDSRWSDWLEGLEVKLSGNEEMILSGPIEDQAALMGVLNKLCRLNLTILSLNELKTKI